MRSTVAPVGLPGLAALALGMVALAVAMLVARRRREFGEAERGAARARASWIGILLQGCGFALAGFGPVVIRLDPLGPAALGGAAAVAALMAFATWLFAAAAAAMGRNWSLGARTRTDHALVTAGPFARVRHPIYVALFLVVVAIAIAFGHWRGLLLALPVFAAGTALRVRVEERLLRARFGAAYDEYATGVARFVPRLF
jgi:protein-S-isoprenylcysteine O-methyltransferase Ste14